MSGERKKERKKRERAKVGDNNGQATHGARKHAWRTQAAWANVHEDIINVHEHITPLLTIETIKRKEKCEQWHPGTNHAKVCQGPSLDPGISTTT